MHGKSARFIEIYEKLWQIWWLEIPGYWPCVSIAWVVQADLLGSENSMLRGNRASFFSTYIATTKNWVLFFLQYRGNDLLIFQDAKREKKLASLPLSVTFVMMEVRCFMLICVLHPYPLFQLVHNVRPTTQFSLNNQFSKKNSKS